MKKLFLIIVGIMMCISLFGCQKKENVINIGQVANDKKLDILFEGAQEFKTIKSDNMYLQDDFPSDGKVFIVMYFEINNKSDKKDGINTFTDVEYYVDNNKADGKMSFNKPNSDYENLFGLIEIEPGSKSKQCIIFEANENWQEAELIYKEAFENNSEKYVFKINRNEIEK